MGRKLSARMNIEMRKMVKVNGCRRNCIILFGPAYLVPDAQDAEPSIVVFLVGLVGNLGKMMTE